MKLGNKEIALYMNQANHYCDMAMTDLEKYAQQYTMDCESGKIDLVGEIIIPPLVDIYYSVKKGIMSRNEAIERQKGLFDVIELED